MDNEIQPVCETPVVNKQDSKLDRRLNRELREERADTQRHMAWVALSSILGVTCILFSPIISDSRVQSVADLLGLFYIALAGVVGAYMGVTAWMSSPSKQQRSKYYDYDGE